MQLDVLDCLSVTFAFGYGSITKIQSIHCIPQPFLTFIYHKLKFSVILKKHTTWSKNIPYGQKTYHMVLLYAHKYHMIILACGMLSAIV